MRCDAIVIPASLRLLDAAAPSPAYQKSEAARSHAT